MNKKNFPLTNREISLIVFIRKLRFGKIEIDVRDGIPQARVKQKEKIIDLDKFDYNLK